MIWGIFAVLVLGVIGAFSWGGDADGTHNRLPWFTDQSWPLRTASGPDGESIVIPSRRGLRLVA